MPRQMQEARYRVSDRGLRENRTIHLCRFGEPALGINLEEHSMNKVLRITLAGEQELLADAHPAACIREANRINAERGYTNGVCVMELEDGQRMTAADCKAAA